MNRHTSRARTRLLAVLATAAMGIAATGAYVNAQTAAEATTEALAFVPTAPKRVLDTRNDIGRSTKFESGDVYVLEVAGADHGGVPPNAEAVAINLTSTGVEAYGWVAVWPNGQPQPPTSAANLQINEDVPNSGIFGLGDNGALSIYVYGGPTDLVVDITGYFVPGSGGSGSLSSGSSDPSGSCEPGAGYLNLTTGDSFECIAAGTWDQVSNLTGATGARGPAGADGIDGDDGATGPQGEPGTAVAVTTTPGAPTAPGGTEGDLVIDSIGDLYQWNGTSWVLVGNTAPPRAGGSVADSAAVIDVPLLSVIDDPGNDEIVGSVTGLPVGTYDASATVDLSIEGAGLLSVGLGIQARCWWSSAPTEIFTTSLTAGVDLNVVLLNIALPGIASGSITVPGTLSGDADLVCDAGGTVTLSTGIDVRSVDISAVRVGTSVGTVSF